MDLGGPNPKSSDATFHPKTLVVAGMFCWIVPWKTCVKISPRKTGWWFQPLWKIWVKMGSSSPRIGVKKNIFELPPPRKAQFSPWKPNLFGFASSRCESEMVRKKNLLPKMPCENSWVGRIRKNSPKTTQQNRPRVPRRLQHLNRSKSKWFKLHFDVVSQLPNFRADSLDIQIYTSWGERYFRFVFGVQENTELRGRPPPNFFPNVTS